MNCNLGAKNEYTFYIYENGNSGDEIIKGRINVRNKIMVVEKCLYFIKKVLLILSMKSSKQKIIF